MANTPVIMRYRKSATILATILLALTGCGAGKEYVRLDRPIPLPVGEPRTPCEKASFLELVPSQATVTRSAAYTAGSYSHFSSSTAEAVGLAAYQRESDIPVLVVPLLSGPGLEDALARHLRPMERIYAKRTTSLVLGGAMLAGAGISVAIFRLGSNGADWSNTSRWNMPLAIGGVVGLFVSAAVGWVGVFTMPTVADYAELAIRERMFLPPVDHPGDAVQAVNARNQQARQQCEAPAAPPAGH